MSSPGYNADNMTEEELAAWMNPPQSAEENIEYAVKSQSKELGWIWDAVKIAYQEWREARARKREDALYDKERADALADRDYALEYQLPENVMKRNLAAGLNPNLFYGGMTSGGSLAIRGTSHQNRQTGPNPFSLENRQAMARLNMDIQSRGLENDNLLLQGKVLQNSIPLTQAQTMKTMSEANMSEENRKRFNDLFAYQLQALEYDNKMKLLNLDEKKQSIYIAMEDFNLRKIANESNTSLQAEQIRKTVQETLLLKQKHAQNLPEAERLLLDAQLSRVNAQTSVDQLEASMKEIEYKRMQAGASRNSPWYVNLVAQAIAEYLGIEWTPPTSNTPEDYKREGGGSW